MVAVQALCQAWGPPEVVDTLMVLPLGVGAAVVAAGRGWGRAAPQCASLNTLHSSQVNPTPLCAAQQGSQSNPLGLEGGNQADLSGHLWVLLEFEQTGHCLGFLTISSPVPHAQRANLFPVAAHELPEP